MKIKELKLAIRGLKNATSARALARKCKLEYSLKIFSK